MKSSNIPENTQGNKEGLVQWLNDKYADNQPWAFLGPGIGENRGYPCTLHQFEVAGLYIDLRLATDKYGFNVLGVQPWHFYEKGEYRDGMDWLLKNRKPSKIITVVLSLGGHGFFNFTSPEDVAFVLQHSDELNVIVTGPPTDKKTWKYRDDVIKAVADSGKPVHIYSSADDIHDGTSYIHSQTLHDQLKAAGAKVDITMFTPGYGHNGTALHVWKSTDFYKWAKSSQLTPSPEPVPTPPIPPVADPVTIPPTPVPQQAPAPEPQPSPVPAPDTKPRKIVGYNFSGTGLIIQAVFDDESKELYKAPDGDVGTNVWLNLNVPNSPAMTLKKGKPKRFTVK